MCVYAVAVAVAVACVCMGVCVWVCVCKDVNDPGHAIQHHDVNAMPCHTCRVV